MRLPSADNLHEYTPQERELIELFKKGIRIKKIGRRGRPKYKLLKLSQDETKLSWKSTWKSEAKTTVDLRQIDRLQPGCTTANMARVRRDVEPLRSFSLVYNGTETLDLVNDHPQSRVETASLQRTLQELWAHRREKEHLHDDLTKYATAQWERAGGTRSNTLSLAQIGQLMKRVNVHCGAEYVRKMFNEVDADSSGDLDFGEFLVLCRRLRARREVERLFDRLCAEAGLVLTGLQRLVREREPLLQGEPASSNPHRLVLPLAQAHVFFRDVQKDATAVEGGEEATRALLLKLDPENGGHSLGYEPFCTYLCGGDNDVHDPRKEAEVYQDLGRPLSHYWIASSHNTYLEGDQLRSASSVNRYINDLSKGCRCVELDCWDGEPGVHGPKGEVPDPIIYHGHTLTKKIFFKDVIQAVADYSFQTSPLPIILSFENHCSIPVQQKMAAYCVEILGDKLAVPRLTPEGQLPSPKSLEGKVIIKAKYLPTENRRHSFVEGAAAAAGEETAAEPLEEEDSESEPEKEGEMPKKKKDKKKKKVKIAAELSAITFLGGTHFKDWELSKGVDANLMSSFGETKSEKLLGKAAANWVEYNTRQMSRIYPAGHRVNSSNYDPVPHWCAGSQIVALNYQTGSAPMQLNDGLFRDNGRSGYLLKPACLRAPGFDPDQPGPPRQKLVVHVISGSQFPKPEGAHKGEVIDPYVVVEVTGVAPDRRQCKTAVIDDNGFNPIFDETFEFDICQPELAILNLCVMDKDLDADDFIASAALRVTAVRQGFRSVTLRDARGHRQGLFQFASLLCRFELTDL